MTDAAPDAVVYGAGELVVGPAGEGPAPATDGSPPDPDEVLDVREDAAVAIVDGEVAAVGPTGAVTDRYPPEAADTAIDAAGRAVLPGFVDSHTHAVFAGDRSDEFAAKLRGATYQDILAEGGGILRTVRATRAADDEALLERLLGHLDAMLAGGSTTVEVKSGYGLDVETELRLLSVVERADEAHPVDIVPTFMGAHAVPEGRETAEYVEEVVDEQVPAVAEQGVAAFCDVFCEEGVFSVEESRRVLEAGREHGLAPKVHAEEFVRLGGAQLGAEVGAVSADHLLHANGEDIEALRDAGVVPVMLPGTAFGLGGDYADARAFRDAGAPLAVATDFNPNCYAPRMGFAATLACVEMGLSPAEAVRACTRGGALALGADRASAFPDGPPLDPKAGTLAVGAPGDLLVLDAPTHVHVPYRYGDNVVRTVLKGGRPVVGPEAEREADA
ncbi:imidazolonepropionase [Natronomonas marina]|jgi:imidazolonepropionase|uniref:imidazolonepropionase n=1 Tax=Natronomonas marina TaxID=2961939 RepID=UPI0020C97218|nr:imidazolonepropionase [Natronomonas marina]